MGNENVQTKEAAKEPEKKKRNSRSVGHDTKEVQGQYVGKGSRGLNLKRLYRKELKLWKPKGSYPHKTLKAFARHLAEGRTGTNEEAVGMAKGWLMAKTAGTPEQRSARKQRLKDRRSINLASKMARKSKGKQNQKKSAA